MRIIPPSENHVEPWARLRAELWPGDSIESHREALAKLFFSGTKDAIAFLALDAGHEPIGFAEAGLRRDFVNGCGTSPVLFLEGIYVKGLARRKGVARALCTAVADWGKAQACTEFASDALLDNLESHAFHDALGFVETERVVYFRKAL